MALGSQLNGMMFWGQPLHDQGVHVKVSPLGGTDATALLLLGMANSPTM